MKFQIAVLPGDGIGEEVMAEALKVLEAVAKKFNHQFDLSKGLVGGAAYDKYNDHFPNETRELCRASDAILFGSVGGPVAEANLPKWKNCERNSILAVRKAFGFNANLRPAKVFSQLKESCPLKNRIVENGVDLLVVRELLGDIYFGEHKSFVKDNVRAASDIAVYDERQIESIARIAFNAASKRSKRLVSVDKANVLDSSRLWRQIVEEVAKDYPDISLLHMYVDNAAMQLVTNPSQFDVLLTSNMFGDILSDEASVLAGSLGLIPSASLNTEGFGLYEPAGGSAPDIAGKGIANPIAQILCVAMMLKYSFNLIEASLAVETAVNDCLSSGKRTQDIYTEGTKLLSTHEMGDAICAAI